MDKNNQSKKGQGKFSFKNASDKAVKYFANKRGYVAVAFFILAIALALYLNWSLTSTEFGNDDDYISTLFSGENATPTAIPTAAPTSDDAINDEFFSNAKLAKTKARDESVEILKAIIENSLSSEDARDTAAGEMSEIAASIATEANIESLLNAKGFEHVMATVSSSGATVMVRKENLTGAQVAQIKDIILSETGLSVDKIKVNEVK